MAGIDNTEQLVAVFAPLYLPAFRGGGPIRSIAALVASAPQDIVPVVLTSDRDLGGDTPLPVEANTWLRLPVGRIYYATTNSLTRLWRAFLQVRKLRPAMIHFNSFMNPRVTILPLLLWRFGFWGSSRILLAPRGEFGGGALRRRSLKKRVYIFVFRLLGIHHSVIWHSTARHETEDIRSLWGPRVTIIERENNTLLAKHARRPEVVAGPIRAAFLGRIVEHKGLSVALAALAGVAEPVQFDIYGSREDQAYSAHCEALARELPDHIMVTFHEAVAPDDVVDLLAEHDILLMPTSGENFGHVIAEALSVSCFVVTTAHTPWTESFSDGGGLVLERSPATWADAIQELARDGEEQRLARRRAAGDAYETWLARPQPPHIWTLALDKVAEQRAEGRKGL